MPSSATTQKITLTDKSEVVVESTTTTRVPEARTVDLPALSFRADVVPSSIDREKRTVDVVFSTGAPVKRYDYASGEFYIETLSMDPAHIRLERLNSGAPVLDSHSGYALENVLGVVQRGSAKVVKKQAVATLRFSKRDDVEPKFRDVEDGITPNVSTGYVVHSYQETAGKNGGLKQRLAIDWEPFEVSMVPMPADINAQTRDGKPAGAMHPCQIVTRGDEPTPQESRMDPENNLPETLTEPDPIQPRMSLADPPAPTDVELATRAERDRVEGLTAAARAARVSSEMLDRLIRDGVALVDGQRQIFDELRKRLNDQAPTRPQAPSDVRLGDDPLVHVRSGIENALAHRVIPKDAFPKSGVDLTDVGRQYRAMSILDTAELILKHQGKRTTSMTRMDIVKAALDTRAGYHTTSDFGEILGNVIKAVIRAGYAEEMQTWQPISRRVNATDFRQMKTIQVGDAPDLEKVLEHGEFTRGTIAESKETMQLETYGSIFAITRQALVNDDLDAFSTIPAMFGRAARKKESDLVWAVITGNPVMGDNNALFSAAHSNLQTDGDVISITSMSRARLAMRLQTGVNDQRINLVPRILIVPPSLETAAEQFLAPILAAQTNAAQNPFAGKFTLIVEPRLEDNSSTAWYIATSSDQLPVINYAYLDGQEGVSIETRTGFDIDGVETRARLDFDAAPADWRGIHKDPGEAVS